jgi:hypothetical protein
MPIARILTDAKAESACPFFEPAAKERLKNAPAAIPISDACDPLNPGKVIIEPSRGYKGRFTTNARDLLPVPAQHSSPAVEVVSSMWIPEYRKSGFR